MDTVGRLGFNGDNNGVTVVDVETRRWTNQRVSRREMDSVDPSVAFVPKVSEGRLGFTIRFAPRFPHRAIQHGFPFYFVNRFPIRVGDLVEGTVVELFHLLGDPKTQHLETHKYIAWYFIARMEATSNDH